MSGFWNNWYKLQSGRCQWIGIYYIGLFFGNLTYMTFNPNIIIQIMFHSIWSFEMKFKRYLLRCPNLATEIGSMSQIQPVSFFDGAPFKQADSENTNIFCTTNFITVFPLAPMGVLAPGSAHAWPSAQPPIDTSGNLSAHLGGEFWKVVSSIFSPF